MSDVPLSGIIGGGGILKISSAGLGGTIPSGTSAPFTISCPANKFLKLTQFRGTTGNQGGVSLDVGGRSIYSSNTVTQSSASGNQVKIGLTGVTSEGFSSLSQLGGRGEDFVFSFDAATSQTLNYSYEVLEDA